MGTGSFPGVKRPGRDVDHPPHLVKWSRYRPGVAQRVGRGIALLFHDRGIRRGWVVSSTPRPHFTPGKDPVPILQEAGWAPGPVWTGGKSRPRRNSIPDRPARSLCSKDTYWDSPYSGFMEQIIYFRVYSSRSTDPVPLQMNRVQTFPC